MSIGQMVVSIVCIHGQIGGWRRCQGSMAGRWHWWASVDGLVLERSPFYGPWVHGV
ncbi:hypothetical protein L3556_02680 [Candidatus Synechococcus calcipolaris G9]|uniref:Uncharacterized protein n=1 Tax=Candidatus Synechococcus calcipolaris G9 TaxID=1497997 RepID=A0ABT6EVL6_9SYNE|nr:hypothetical protein [Candidatus Synechococcus calcipolaris]MDG2989844.1 hypothetical protein [Candidatus Synechococcus calcipolaris G9]